MQRGTRAAGKATERNQSLVNGLTGNSCFTRRRTIAVIHSLTLKIRWKYSAFTIHNSTDTNAANIICTHNVRDYTWIQKAAVWVKEWDKTPLLSHLRVIVRQDVKGHNFEREERKSLNWVMHKVEVKQQEDVSADLLSESKQRSNFRDSW